MVSQVKESFLLYCILRLTKVKKNSTLQVSTETYLKVCTYPDLRKLMQKRDFEIKTP